MAALGSAEVVAETRLRPGHSGDGTMENALLIGLSRQVALARELDTIANNVANLGTHGFKAHQLRFEEYLNPTASADAFENPDRTLSYVIDKNSGIDFSQGPVQRTENPLDIAISGNAVLAVQTGSGERYTRNGALQINTRGELVTSDGHRVLGEGGPITFTAEETGIGIGKDGTVSSSEGQKGKLRLLAVPNPGQLENAGFNTYTSATPLRAAAATDVRVESGAIEQSNVKPVLEMSRLIEVNRAYTSVAQMLQRNDELARSALQQLSSVPNA
jgi:flagellar basal-body rod protein FlgF